jgi:hypothetical protein
MKKIQSLLLHRLIRKIIVRDSLHLRPFQTRRVLQNRKTSYPHLFRVYYPL